MCRFLFHGSKRRTREFVGVMRLLLFPGREKKKKKLTLKATQKKREKEKFKQKKKKVIALHRNLTRSMC